YMITSGMDKKMKVFDVRAFKPLRSYFLPAGASCLSLSQRGLLSAATGDIVQVIVSSVVRSWPSAFQKCTDWKEMGPGAGEPNFDGLDANPYRSAKQRQEWEVKALLEKIQPELITLDPTELAQVDRTTFEQRHRDRVEALRPSGAVTQLVETKAPAVACAEKVSHPPAAVDTGWGLLSKVLNFLWDLEGEEEVFCFFGSMISVEELTAAVGQMVLSKSHSRPFIKTFGRFWEYSKSA
ncbi:hypothetical protein GOODEAATRI_018583, partial [Goodea atripinnis]